MQKKKIKDNDISNEYYQKLPIGKGVFLFIICLILTFSFLVNFSPKELIINKVSDLMISNPNCPLNFNNMNVEFFLPKLTFKELIVPARCLGQGRSDFIFKDVKINLRGIGPFSPVLRLKINANFYKSIIHAHLVLSKAEQEVDLAGSILDVESLLTSLNSPFKGSGKIETLLVLNFANGSVKTGDVILKSKNIFVPSQNVMGFVVPEMPLNVLSVRAKMQGLQSINLESMALGDENSPLKILMNGVISVPYGRLMDASLNLNSQIKPSESLLNELSILKVVLAQYPEKNGHYQIKWTGPIMSPLPMPGSGTGQ